MMMCVEGRGQNEGQEIVASCQQPRHCLPAAASPASPAHTVFRRMPLDQIK